MASQEQEQELAEFNSVFPDIVKCLTLDLTEVEDDEINDPILRFKQTIEYNVPNGTKLHGLIVVKAFKQLCASDEIDKNELYLAQVLGWCIELFNGFVIMQDDIIDQAEIRRGQICWYKKEEIGLNGTVDAFMLILGVFGVLKKHIKNKSYYADVVTLFHYMSFKVAMGQSLARMISPTPGQLDFQKFTMQNFIAIAKYQDSYFNFYLSIALAMYMTGMEDEKLHEEAKQMAFEIGFLFRIQEDYIDCFVDPAISGKIGMDVALGKCSWMIVKALELANAKQMVVIRENYGRNDVQCIAKIKQVYEELEIAHHFLKYEDETYNNIEQLIDDLNTPLLANVFKEVIKSLYKRRS